MAFCRRCSFIAFAEVLDYFSCIKRYLALEWRFGRPNDTKWALERRFGRSGGANLTLERHVCGSSGVKLTLERRFGRSSEAMLTLERRFGCPWTPSGPWNDVLGRRGSRCKSGRSECPGVNFV